MVLQDFVPSCILPSVLSPSNRCNLSCVPEQTNSLTTESAFVCLALFSHSINCKNSTTEPSLRIVSRWCFSDNAGSRYALLPVGRSGSGEEDIQPAQGSRSASVDGYRGRGDGEHQRLVSTVECVWTLHHNLWHNVGGWYVGVHLCVFRMAAGVEEAVVICPFMTPAYQASRSCKKELNYADTREVIMVPVMLANNWEASEWLGLITAGLLWVDFRWGGLSEGTGDTLYFWYKECLCLNLM